MLRGLSRCRCRSADGPGLGQQPAAGRPVYAYVGSFTSAERKASGNGINVYRMDPETGVWSHVQQVGELVNPSFLVLSRTSARFIRFMATRTMPPLSPLIPRAASSSSWAAPIPAARTAYGKRSTRAAGSSSSPTTPAARWPCLPVAEDGALRNQTQLFELKGTPGPHRVRQVSSHPHDIVFDPSGRFVVVPDLGLDRTFVFRFDPAAGQLTEASFVDGRPTSGRATSPSTRRAPSCGFSTSWTPP